MTNYIKRDDIEVPFCVNIEDVCYEQYEEVYQLCQKYSQGVGSENPMPSYASYNYVGVDWEGDIYHWHDCSLFAEGEDNEEDVDVWENAQTFIDAHTKEKSSPKVLRENSSKNTNEMRVVVYYTDGSAYTNKLASKVDSEEGKLYIYFNVAGKPILQTKQIEAGVKPHTSKTMNSEVVEIDLEHVAGYCLMCKNGFGFWNKEYVPVKANFHVEALVANAKECVSRKEHIPHKQRVQPTGAGSGFSPKLTKENYVPEEGDYIVVRKPHAISFLEDTVCNRFVAKVVDVGFGRGEQLRHYTAFTNDTVAPQKAAILGVYNEEVIWAYIHGNDLDKRFKRDVTHIFTK